MFPIAQTTLSIHEIADYWSRESSATYGELLESLIGAWWKGDLKNQNSKHRLLILRKIFERPGDNLIVVANNDPKPTLTTSHKDGSVTCDIRPILVVPSRDTSSWTEANCRAAFMDMAKAGLNFPAEFLPALMSFEVDSSDFFQWIEDNKFQSPQFWVGGTKRRTSPKADRAGAALLKLYLNKSVGKIKRAALRSEILAADPDCAPLDDATLRKAVEAHDSEIERRLRENPIRA